MEVIHAESRAAHAAFVQACRLSGCQDHLPQELTVFNTQTEQQPASHWFVLANPGKSACTGWKTREKRSRKRA